MDAAPGDGANWEWTIPFLGGEGEIRKQQRGSRRLDHHGGGDGQVGGAPWLVLEPCGSLLESLVGAGGGGRSLGNSTRGISSPPPPHPASVLAISPPARARTDRRLREVCMEFPENGDENRTTAQDRGAATQRGEVPRSGTETATGRNEKSPQPVTKNRVCAREIVRVCLEWARGRFQRTVSGCLSCRENGDRHLRGLRSQSRFLEAHPPPRQTLSPPVACSQANVRHSPHKKCHGEGAGIFCFGHRVGRVEKRTRKSTVLIKRMRNDVGGLASDSRENRRNTDQNRGSGGVTAEAGSGRGQFSS